MIGTAAIHAERDVVAPELVGHHDARLIPSAHQLAEKTSGSTGIAAFLDQDFQHITPVIEGTPQPMRLAADGDHHLVDMPFIACRRPIATDLRGDLRPNTIDPCRDRLVADRHTAISQQILNVPQASTTTACS